MPAQVSPETHLHGALPASQRPRPYHQQSARSATFDIPNLYNAKAGLYHGRYIRDYRSVLSRIEKARDLTTIRDYLSLGHRPRLYYRGENMTEFNVEGFWQDRLSANFHLEGVGFCGLGKAFNRWMYRVRRYQFLRIVRSLDLDMSKQDVLDIGPGTGFYIDLWGHRLDAQSVTGADITDVVIENLRNRFPQHQFHKVDISGETIDPLAENTFDLVSCMDVLFHIVGDDLYANAFQNIYRLLRPGGHFIFSENFIHSAEIRHVHHVSRSLRTIENQVTDAGFVIIRRAPMFCLMNTPVDSRSRLINGVWRRLSQLIGRSSFWGTLLGMGLYPVELLLITLLKEGPSTEIMICMKPKETG